MREKLYFSCVIKVSGCIFCSVAESRRQGVDAILCVGIGNESADDPESVCENGQKTEKTSSIAVDEPCLHVLTNNNNNLRNEKKQETKEKTQNDSLAFVTTFLEWLFFSTATTYYYYYLQTKTNIVVPHYNLERIFSLSLSIQFFPLYGGSRRINACYSPIQSSSSSTETSS